MATFVGDKVIRGKTFAAVRTVGTCNLGSLKLGEDLVFADEHAEDLAALGVIFHMPQSVAAGG